MYQLTYIKVIFYIKFTKKFEMRKSETNSNSNSPLKPQHEDNSLE